MRKEVEIKKINNQQCKSTIVERKERIKKNHRVRDQES